MSDDDYNSNKVDYRSPFSCISSMLRSSSLKVALFVLLVFQTSFHTLVGRYTRSSVPKEESFEVTHLIIVVEIIKLLSSSLLESYTTKGQLWLSLKTFVIGRPWDALKSGIPAMMFVIQNSLIFVALTNLSAPLFITINQSKVVITALISVVLLQRSYSIKQWICLVAITLGVIILILDESDRSSTTTAADNATDDNDGNTNKNNNMKAIAEQENQKYLLIGLLSVIGASFSSAFASVYFELVLSPERAKNAKNAAVPAYISSPTTTSASTLSSHNKAGEKSSAASTKTTTTQKNLDKQQQQHAGDKLGGQQQQQQQQQKLPPLPPVASLWMRNIQLAFFSLVSCVLSNARSIVVADGGKPFFHGFTSWVWVLIMLQALGGLLVACVMKYTDSVVKSLATGVSVVVTATISAIFMNTQLSSQYLLGSAIIFTSLFFFSNDFPMDKLHEIQKTITQIFFPNSTTTTTSYSLCEGNNNNNNGTSSSSQAGEKKEPEDNPIIDDEV